MHRIVSISFVLVFGLLLYFVYKGKISGFYLSLPIIVGVGLTSWGAFDLRLNYFTKNYCKAQVSEKVIALTFDDGPTAFTPQVLDLLQKYNAKATFFCIGNRIEKDEKIFRRIVNEGHLIGNHTYSHSTKMGFFSTEKVKNEIAKTDDIIHRITGKSTPYFRPPFGVTNPNIAKALNETGHQVIGWNIRSLDTVIDDEDRILRRVLPRIQPGSIILLHDTSQKTVNVLEQILKGLQAEGYKMVTIEELKKIENET